MVTAMMNDEKMKSLAETAETFINSACELDAVFLSGYDGGDFCSGLIFGRAGSRMLVEVA